jgi:lysophospholipase L1-like esterase
MTAPRRLPLLAVYAAAAAMAFGAAEIWARRAWPQRGRLPVDGPVESLRYRPTVFASHVFAREEMRATPDFRNPNLRYRINAKGYRGRDFDLRKPPSTIRIIVYGGSAAFDIYASDPDDWPHRVEQLLAGSGVEVINAGIPGHASWDCLGRFFAEGHTLGPDIVVLYEAWNDIKHFDSDEPLLRRVAPYVPQQDARRTYRNTADRWMNERSRLYALLRERWLSRGLTGHLEGRPRERKVDRVSEAALRQYRLTLESFVDLARRARAVPVLMTQARLVRAGNAPQERARIGYDMQPLTPEALLDAFDRVDATVREVAAESRVDVIDAARAVSDADDFADHVHLRASGSARLAAAAADGLSTIVARVRGSAP